MAPSVFRRLVLIALFLALGCRGGFAQSVSRYHVRINAASLYGLGAHALDFQLVDGALDGNGNATATIRNFTLNGGTLAAPTYRFGNATGAIAGLTDALVLRDGPSASGMLADFMQSFTVTFPFSEIHFDLELSATSVETGWLDSFAMLILNGVYSALTTSGPFGVEMVSADFDALAPLPLGWGTFESPLLLAEVTPITSLLSSITLDSFSTCSTLPVQATVKLNAPAPTNGTVVQLSASPSGVVSIPTSVTVPANASSFAFPVQTLGVAAETNVTITASQGGTQRRVVMRVQPLLQSLSLERKATWGVAALNGTVAIRCPRPGVATQILLSSGHPALSVPTSVTIPAGETSASFPVATQETGTVLDVYVQASDGAAVERTKLRLYPQFQYTLIDLGGLGGQNAYATALNDFGQAVGYAETPAGDTHAVLYQNGQVLDLGTLGGQNSYAYGINALGQITGKAQDAIGNDRAFLYADEFMADLGALGGENSVGWAITQAMLVAGDAETEQGERHAFANLIGLGTLGGLSSHATGVNQRGQMTGDAQLANGDAHAFLYDRGVFFDLGTLGGLESFGTGVNFYGQATGYSDTGAGERHAFFYDGGALQDLGTLPDGQHSVGKGIDLSGRIVGTSVSIFGEERAFLACAGTMQDLNGLVVNLGGWTLCAATGIDQQGRIVGTGKVGGDVRAFLLQPNLPTTSYRTVSGNIALTHAPDAAYPLTFLFRSAAGTPLFEQSVSPQPDGSYQLRGIPAGVYSLAARGVKWLQRAVAVDVSAGDAANVNALLLPGDVNGDNIVDLFDLVALFNAYGSVPTDTTWHDGADWNQDMIVDLFDLVILFDYYGEEGDL